MYIILLYEFGFFFQIFKPLNIFNDYEMVWFNLKILIETK